MKHTTWDKKWAFGSRTMKESHSMARFVVGANALVIVEAPSVINVLLFDHALFVTMLLIPGHTFFKKNGPQHSK